MKIQSTKRKTKERLWEMYTVENAGKFMYEYKLLRTLHIYTHFGNVYKHARTHTHETHTYTNNRQKFVLHYIS